MESRRLDWAAFDEAADAMAAMLSSTQRQGCAIYGIPRGGMPLAVAVSHRTGIPLLTENAIAHDRVVIIDDVVESGETLRRYKPGRGAFLCWVNKNPALASQVQSVIELPASTWVIFPWEVPECAPAEAADYHRRRGAAYYRSKE